MHKHIRLSLSTVSLVLTVGAVLGLVNWRAPEDLGPAGIAAFFLLVYLSAVQIFLLGHLLVDYLKGVHKDIAQHLAGSFGAALPIVMLLALNTIRDITVIDFGLALIFGLVLVFYLRRRA